MDKLPEDVDEIISKAIQKGVDDFEAWKLQFETIEKVKNFLGARHLNHQFSVGWLRSNMGMNFSEDIPDCATATLKEITCTGEDGGTEMIIQFAFDDFEWIDINYIIEDGEIVEP